MTSQPAGLCLGFPLKNPYVAAALRGPYSCGEPMRKLLLLVIVAIATSFTTGCFSFVDWEHNLNHLKAWNEDLDRIHRTIDRYIFNYDYEDPSRDIEYESPNT